MKNLCNTCKLKGVSIWYLSFLMCFYYISNLFLRNIHHKYIFERLKEDAGQAHLWPLCVGSSAVARLRSPSSDLRVRFLAALLKKPLPHLLNLIFVKFHFYLITTSSKLHFLVHVTETVILLRVGSWLLVPQGPGPPHPLWRCLRADPGLLCGAISDACLLGDRHSRRVCFSTELLQTGPRSHHLLKEIQTFLQALCSC